MAQLSPCMQDTADTSCTCFQPSSTSSCDTRWYFVSSSSACSQTD